MTKRHLSYISIALVLTFIGLVGCSPKDIYKPNEIDIDIISEKNEDAKHIGPLEENDPQEDEDTSNGKPSIDNVGSDNKTSNREGESGNVSSKGDIQSNEDEKSLTLTKLLPHRPEYTWVYYGSTEYGHTMTLNSIETSKNNMIYSITGEVDDMSDGESKKDFSLKVTYVVTENSIIQTVDSDMMMDSKLSQIELIRTPLSKGNKWVQTQKDSNGKTIKLDSTIDDIREDNGQKIYTIIYKDRDSKYYERREIKEGVGVISLEHLLFYENEGRKESMPMGYTLYSDYSGYKNNLSINKYLPTSRS